MAKARPSEYCPLCLRCHRRLVMPCGIKHRAEQPENPERRCTKCGEPHHRKSGWCKSCFNTWRELHAERGGLAEIRERERTGRVGGPPPPPPGFLPSDLATGRPLM